MNPKPLPAVAHEAPELVRAWEDVFRAFIPTVEELAKTFTHRFDTDAFTGDGVTLPYVRPRTVARMTERARVVCAWRKTNARTAQLRKEPQP